MKKLLELRNEQGATAVEYGLFLVLIALAIIFTVGLLGEAVSALFASELWPW